MSHGTNSTNNLLRLFLRDDEAFIFFAPILSFKVFCYFAFGLTSKQFTNALRFAIGKLN